jgi:hypothetical protein
VLHHVEGDEGAGAAQARLAMHCDTAGSGGGGVEKGSSDVGGRSGAVREGKMMEGESHAGETIFVVRGLVKAHHVRHAKVWKDISVVLGTEFASLATEISEMGSSWLVTWAAKGDEFVGNDLMHVTIYDAVIMLIFGQIDGAPDFYRI